MEASIRILKEKKLVGKRMTMSFSENKTGDLWKGFMPQRKEIRKNVGPDLFSIQIYSPEFFSNFNPNAEFEKWAAVEVSDFESVPGQMETITLEGGLYAVFLYRGAAADAAGTFRYILGEWMRGSAYDLDNRPHFEILGEKYKNESPDSEEELWIPVKLKAVAPSIAP